MLAEVSTDEVAHRRRLARIDPAAKGIMAGIDLALQPLRFLTRGGHRPIRRGTDGEAALATGDAIGKDKRPGAGRIDAEAEAGDLVIEEEKVARALRLNRFGEAFCEVRLHVLARRAD